MREATAPGIKPADLTTQRSATSSDNSAAHRMTQKVATENVMRSTQTPAEDLSRIRPAPSRIAGFFTSRVQVEIPTQTAPQAKTGVHTRIIKTRTSPDLVLNQKTGLPASARKHKSRAGTQGRAPLKIPTRLLKLPNSKNRKQ